MRILRKAWDQEILEMGTPGPTFQWQAFAASLRGVLDEHLAPVKQLDYSAAQLWKAIEDRAYGR